MHPCCTVHAGHMSQVRGFCAAASSWGRPGVGTGRLDCSTNSKGPAVRKTNIGQWWRCAAKKVKTMPRNKALQGVGSEVRDCEHCTLGCENSRSPPHPPHAVPHALAVLAKRQAPCFLGLLFLGLLLPNEARSCSERMAAGHTVAPVRGLVANLSVPSVPACVGVRRIMIGVLKQSVLCRR